jgi:hypothetical protein
MVAGFCLQQTNNLAASPNRNVGVADLSPIHRNAPLATRTRATELPPGRPQVERELRDEELDLKTLTELRRKRAQPLDDWVEVNREEVDSRGPLHAAIVYYTNQRDALHRFLTDGRIRLDNNPSEQALRNLVVGIANWVFFANETGIAWYTVLRSLIASAILHRLNPQIYLEQLLRLLPHWPKHRVLELSPKYWAQTIASLDDAQRATLARPWESNVVLDAQLDAKQQHRPSDTLADTG